MRQEDGKEPWFLTTLTWEQYEALEPEDQILAILDDRWGVLSTDEQDARWERAAEAADKHVLLARSRRARRN